MTEDEQEYDRIIADCTETLDACPDDVIALVRRGSAWLKKKNHDRSIADFDKAIVEDAGSVEARYYRGLALREKAEYDLAITEFTEVILRSPPHKLLCNSYYYRGRCRHDTRAHDDAIDDFTEAIRLAPPSDGKAYVMRGLVWQDLGDDGKAIADFDRAIRNDPVSADAYHNRGNAWVYLGKLRNGIADFTRAIGLDPKSAALTYSSRGIAWRRKGKYAKALADYERALELDPHSAQRRFVLGGFLACCPQCRYRDGRRAVQLMTEACELTDYSHAEYLHYLAAAYAEQGDSPSAISFQQRALTLATDHYDKEHMQDCLELYKAGEPWRLESPTWRERWS